MTDDNLSDVQSLKGGYCAKCNTVWCEPGKCRCTPVEANPVNCPHGIAMDIYCKECEEARIKTDGVGIDIKPLLAGSGNDSILAREIWNAAIEAAALEVGNKISYPTEACAVIRSLKKK